MAPVKVTLCIKYVHLLQHLRWMMLGTPRKYTRPTYTKNNLRGDPKRWKDDVENDIKKDENCSLETCSAG